MPIPACRRQIWLIGVVARRRTRHDHHDRFGATLYADALKITERRPIQGASRNMSADA